ncbi:phage late control D family protein [Sorangium sp. So ce1024]|uniref:phage late control D family protein n=1 Tax=Sorangium sp. So ce1024 TaxID=3133327 RepID=UPI003F053537
MPEQPLSAAAVYSARPTVRLDEQENERASRLLLAMEMTEQDGGLSSLALRLSNVASVASGGAELAFEDERAIKLGTRIQIYAGEVASPQEIFRGVVTGLEAEFSQDAPPELVVLAEDVFQRARLSRRTRLHEDVSLADLARRLADELGLTPRVTGLGERIGTRVQLNESDLAFLRRLLRDHDADMQVVGDELHVSARSDVQRGEIELRLFSQLTRARVVADLAHQVTEVTTSGWDSAQGQRFSGASSGASLGPGAGRTGARLLQDALGARSEHLGHVAALSSAEARALAEAHFDQRARRFVCLEGTAEGNPALRVGTHVRVRGISPRFDNTYYVVKACHRFDQARGYETDFEAECAYLGDP